MIDAVSDDSPPGGHRPWIPIAVGGALVIVCTIAAATGSPGDVEVAVFRWFNEPPGIVGAVLGLIDPLLRPTGLAILTIGFVVLLAATRRATFWPTVIAAATAAGIAWVVDNVVKTIVDRGRPPAYLDDVLLHGYPVDPRGSGYPSSHTAVMVAIVVGAWPWLDRPWRIGGVAFAAAVGADRMYVGAHFPLDVLGGAGIGLVAGGIVAAVGLRATGRAVPA